MFQYYFKLSLRERLKGPLVLNESTGGWRMTCEGGKTSVQEMTEEGGGFICVGEKLNSPHRTFFFLVTENSPAVLCVSAWVCARMWASFHHHHCWCRMFQQRHITLFDCISLLPNCAFWNRHFCNTVTYRYQRANLHHDKINTYIILQLYIYM